MARPKLKMLPVVVGILFAAAFIIIAVAVLDRGNGARIKYLPDGSFIRLLSVDYGTNFSYSVPVPKPWQRKLAAILPSSLASRYQWWLGNSASMSVGGDPYVTSLVIVTAIEQKSPRSQSRLLVRQRLVVCDDQGNESPTILSASTLGNDDGKHFRSIRAWTLPMFPRRSKTLGLRFLWRNGTNDNWRAVGEFHIPNPAFQTYPARTPEPLPATKTNGDLAVTLISLTSGVKWNSDHPEIQAALGELPGVTAAFKVKPSNRAEVWAPKSVEISDATGNKWIPYGPQSVTKRVGDADQFTFAGSLWLGEAWKLRVEFSRTTGFGDDDLWIVRGITIPAAKQAVKLTDSTNKNASILTLVAITGTKAKQPGDMQTLAVEGQVNISIRVTPQPDGTRMSLIEVQDDQGRRVEVEPGPDWGAWNKGRHVFGLTVPDGAKTLDCTFALHKSRFVEFLAPCEMASANATNSNR